MLPVEMYFTKEIYHEDLLQTFIHSDIVKKGAN